MQPQHSLPAAGLIAIVLALSALFCLAGDAPEDPSIRWAPNGPGGTPSFAKHIVPLFNQAGCSARDCHGSFQGQKGFRLSLFGYDLALDHKELTADTKDDDPDGEPRPRIDTADPDASLALRKPLEDGVEHEGGKKLKRGTWQYRMLRDWIVAGAPFDPETEPYLEKLEVIQKAGSGFSPAAGKRIENPSLENGPHRAEVFATFSDGDRLNVTSLATFTSNDEGIAKVSKTGEIFSGGAFGDTHLVAGYGAEVATTQVLIPRRFRPGAFPVFPPNHPVDVHVANKLKAVGIFPSDLCDDSAFLRRAYIDVIGTLPTTEETRTFLADSSPDKRARLIEHLLNREEYAQYWATIWSDWTGNDKGCLNPNYKVTWLWHDWFVDKFAKNVSFDQIARGIIVASSREGRPLEDYLAENEAVASRINTMAKGARKDLFDDGTYGKRTTLDLFWMKRGGDPEEMAIRSASTLLGIQINCAQCHKHPFDRWTQADFESFASFFRVMDVKTLDGEKPKGGRMDYHQVAVYPGIARNGNEGGKVKANPPKILGGEVIGFDPEGGEDPREKLFEWMVDPENPYFARSIVNRLWGHYFGTGIVDPIDDFNAANPPSNPQLLDWLAEDFIAHGFDLKHLHRRILESRTYQLSHEPNETNRHDTRNYSHAQLKRMPAEVLWDALIQVTGSSQRYSTTFVPPGTRMIAMGATRLSADSPEYALRIFGRPKREQTCACERSNETGLTQALFLLNDSDLLAKLADPEGRAAKLARDFPSAADNAALAEEVYLLTLNRYPNPAEIEYVTNYLESSDAPRSETVQDVLWSLMNVREFVFVK